MSSLSFHSWSGLIFFHVSTVNKTKYSQNKGKFNCKSTQKNDNRPTFEQKTILAVKPQTITIQLNFLQKICISYITHCTLRIIECALSKKLPQFTRTMAKQQEQNKNMKIELKTTHQSINLISHMLFIHFFTITVIKHNKVINF